MRKASLHARRCIVLPAIIVFQGHQLTDRSWPISCWSLCTTIGSCRPSRGRPAQSEATFLKLKCRIMATCFKALASVSSTLRIGVSQRVAPRVRFHWSGFEDVGRYMPSQSLQKGRSRINLARRTWNEACGDLVCISERCTYQIFA